MPLSNAAKDFVERAAWTAGQQFFTVLLAINSKSGFINLPWKVALATSAGAAVVSLLTTTLQYIPALKKRIGKDFWLDLGLRLVKTFIASILGTIGAMQFNVLTFDWSNAADLAGVATLTALAKCFLAAGPGQSANPSTMQPENYLAVYPA